VGEEVPKKWPNTWGNTMPDETHLFFRNLKGRKYRNPRFTAKQLEEQARKV
jgi:hypothetical protein